MNNKNMSITLWITSFLFSFILILIYFIYCFAYYDEYQEDVYTKMFNDKNYKYVYDNMKDNNNLSFDEFKLPINIMYDKNTLKNIYYNYYRDSVYKDIDSFIDTYYYGGVVLDRENISFFHEGKTNLTKRRKIKYDDISVVNKNGHKSNLGIKNNILFKIEDSATLFLDDRKLECSKLECETFKMFGGLHTLKYTSNNIDYYGIVNVVRDEQIIDVTNLDSLVKVSPSSNLEDVFNESKYKLDNGTYKMSKCYITNGSCPSKKKTYLTLKSDGTAYLYIYITLDISEDTYIGKYEKDGDFLVLKFDSHVYKVHDYDTKEKTDITGNCDIEMRFKIESDNVISNENYQFRYSA